MQTMSWSLGWKLTSVTLAWALVTVLEVVITFPFSQKK